MGFVFLVIIGIRQKEARNSEIRWAEEIELLYQHRTSVLGHSPPVSSRRQHGILGEPWTDGLMDKSLLKTNVEAGANC